VIRYQVRVARGEQGISRGHQTFEVELEDRMTVLDALFRIQREHDPEFTFRCACRVGMCGTCAASINGIPRLACRTRASVLGGKRITVDPLPNLPVIRDIAVSMQPFFDQWKRVTPGFRPRAPESTELATIPEGSRYMRLSKGKRDCITCGACFGACGVKAASAEYLGPAAINRAMLRLIDPRDGAVEERVSVLDQERAGVWRCHTQFNCTEVCPKGITLTESITWLQRSLLRKSSLRNKA